MNKYDVIIIGAGPSGIFCAYELIQQQQDLREQAHFPMENYLCHQM